MGRSSCGSICAALFLSLSCTSTTIAFTARPDVAISSINSGRSGATLSKNGLSAQAVESDATTEKAGQNESKSLFQFYLLEGGMCPYAARTWITLLELGLPFDVVEVNTRKKEDWFLEINPRGKVPALQNVEDGTVLYESTICDEYLCDVARERDPEGAPAVGALVWMLMPISASEKAHMRLLNDHVDTVLGPAQYTFLMNDDTEKDPELIAALEEALDVLQESLVKRGGPFLMGQDFTLAEAHVLPFFLRLAVSLKHFKGYEIPPKKYAKLLEWYTLCSERESVQAAAKSEERIIEVYQMFVDMKYGFGGLNKNKE